VHFIDNISKYVLAIVPVICMAVDKQEHRHHFTS